MPAAASAPEYTPGTPGPRQGSYRSPGSHGANVSRRPDGASTDRPRARVTCRRVANRKKCPGLAGNRGFSGLPLAKPEHRLSRRTINAPLAFFSCSFPIFTLNLNPFTGTGSLPGLVTETKANTLIWLYFYLAWSLLHSPMDDHADLTYGHPSMTESKTPFLNFPHGGTGAFSPFDY